MNHANKNNEVTPKRPSMPKCGGSKCAHYSEGCWLAYEIRPSKRLDFSSDDYRMMFSKAFRKYWDDQLGSASDPEFFPCFHSECDCEKDCKHLKDSRFMSSRFKKKHPEKVHEPGEQTHKDYLGELPTNLHVLLQSITTNYHKNMEVRDQLDELAIRFIPKRLEAAVMLLDLYDVVEVSCLNSMVPSQKSEWCWYHYNSYFRLFTQIIVASHKNLEDGAEEFHGQFEYLIKKFHYEWERRKSVLNNGSLRKFKEAIRPIRGFVEISFK